MSDSQPAIGTNCGWCGRSLPGGTPPLADRIAALEAELAERTRERDKARADVQWMFDKAAEREPTLDGYRELGAKCAELEEGRDAERERRKAAEAALRTIKKSTYICTVSLQDWQYCVLEVQRVADAAMKD